MGYLRRIIDANPALLSLAKKIYGMGMYRLANPFPAALPARQGGKPRLIVDMTTLSNSDFGTGIQRVVKKLYEALDKAAANRVDLASVYATGDRPGYFLAPRNTACSGPMFRRTREPLAVKRGDVFLALDFAPDVILAQRATLKTMRRQGMGLFFLVHDLLPVLRPDWFSMGTADVHAAWLKKIAELGDPICVSDTVRGELAQWLESQGRMPDPAHLHWLHNGCDLGDFCERGFRRQLDLPETPYLLVVSTVEPRKGHSQILDAFECLWARNASLSLVLAGKEGWLMQKTADRLKAHPELNKRLFWLQDLNDAELGRFYRNALAVLSASQAEGFGLSLVEGASHGKPLIVRDLPVFREVAGKGASYFSGDEGEDLAEAIESWLKLKALGQIPDSSRVKVLSWRQSAEMLMDILEAGSSLRFDRSRLEP